MQISATIMRLVVILSVLVQIYANTGGVAWNRPGATGQERGPAGRSVLAVLPPVTERTPERNVYRTKLSKLRLILLADVLNEIPPPQLELITCLANSSTLNVTTKHCDCEVYSCKDLLAGSSPSPHNSIQPKRKIYSSCREHCCRKKKFNRSIDPATLENVVAASLSPVRRFNPTSILRLPVPVLVPVSSTVGVQVSNSSTPWLRPTGSPSPGGVRDLRDRPAVGEASCGDGGIDPLSIAGNRARPPGWLYRVGLIETKHPVCVGALIHPSLILTTAVCVINKKPEELAIWSAPEVTDSTGPSVRYAVSRIILPEQFATTFERLEHNVALLLLLPPLPSSSTEPRPILRGLRAWPMSVRDAGTGRSNLPGTQLFRAQRKRTPAPAICLSSIIDRPFGVGPIPTGSCYTVSLRRSSSSRTSPQPAASDTDNLPPSDGTNYVTTNISIFPATECRPEHREYLQHGGNLCAGFAGVAKTRSLDVDYSGSPLICDQPGANGQIHRTIRGLLTWSTDINHAPHLFTNLTAYRPWIEREIAKLDNRPQRPRGQSSGSAEVTTDRGPSVLYG
ncbi:uncharacterized protein LOC128720215 [Anopheles nili]|uniref:uncharacterized protein LOC128720215 n=1 Tax=Anopheles nili TaxID=185578 RepID=UPI00237BA2E7|nr:uncharacterized protein LOC128720215 [Anopheles nili]